MLNEIYRCADVVIELILSLMIARYVFLIPPLRQVHHKLLYIFLTLAVCIPLRLWTDISFVCLSIGLYCFLTAEKHPIQRIPLFVPIIGIVNGIRMPVSELPVLLLNPGAATVQIYSLAIDGVILLLYFIFLFRGRKWRKNFQEEMHYRHLKGWEQTMLYVVGILMFLFAPILTTYKKIDADNYMLIATIISCGISIIAFVVTLTMITLILQGNKRAHFQEQVVQMQQNIIITMADIVENRDANTGGHIRRTAKYVEIIAQQLVVQKKYRQILTKRYIADMIIAAPLHDMGKIHVPDAVLNKQGTLTEEEFLIMQGHTTAGKMLLMQAQKQLGNFSYLEMAVQMAGSHHEKWDGTGYPEQLSGQEIPLCARIMAVADVFDALVSKRCYKEEMSVEEAYAILREESGTHFDPVVVDAFLDASEQIEEVWNTLKEEQ